MKITKRELRRLLGEAVLEKGWESWDDWQNPGAYAPGTKPVTRAAAEEEVEFAPSGRVEDPSREEMWGFYEDLGGEEEGYEDLREAKDAVKKTRPDGYTDLPAFMSINKQSPTKYSGYGAQLGHGVIDDPAVVDPLGDDIDAGALRQVNRLMQRGEDKKKDKKKLKERTMSVTRKDIRRLVNEALSEMMGREEVDCLYILKRGGQYVYIVAPPYLESAAELEEMGRDITDMIMSGGPSVRDANVYEFLSSNPQVAVVRVRGAYEMAEDYMMTLEDNLGASTGPVFEAAFPEELEGVYGAAPPEDAEEMSGETGDQMLFIMPRGFRLRFYLTDYNANPLGDEAEDVTEQILPASMPDTSTAAMAQKILAWLDAHPEVGHVYDEEIHDSTDDDSDTVDEYRMHLEGLISDEGGLEADEGGGEMDFVDYETGADDVPYGAADVALRMGRGYRTDEGDFDPDVGYIDDPKSARHGKPMKRRSADDEPLNEARWAKLAGILKG